MTHARDLTPQADMHLFVGTSSRETAFVPLMPANPTGQLDQFGEKREPHGARV